MRKAGFSKLGESPRRREGGNILLSGEEEIEEADGSRTRAELTEESGQNPEDERTQFVLTLGK